jgi:hypothetical protein
MSVASPVHDCSRCKTEIRADTDVWVTWPNECSKHRHLRAHFMCYLEVPAAERPHVLGCHCPDAPRGTHPLYPLNHGDTVSLTTFRKPK